MATEKRAHYCGATVTSGSPRCVAKSWMNGLPGTPAPPQQRTGNAQQRRRHKALMRNTAAGCFPSTSRRTPTRLGIDLAGCGRARLCSDTRRREMDAHSAGQGGTRASPAPAGESFHSPAGCECAAPPRDGANLACRNSGKTWGPREGGRNSGCCPALPLLPSRKPLSRNNADATRP
jgi:hypothetical protein